MSGGSKDTSSRTRLMDMYINSNAGIGGGRDKSTAGYFSKSQYLGVDYSQLAGLYEEEWTAQRFVDIIPDDMTREWRVITDTELSLEEKQEFRDYEEFLNLPYLFNQAQKLANIYGNSYIFLDIEGTGEPWEPLNLDSIKENASFKLTLRDRSKVVGLTPFSSDCGVNYQFYMPVRDAFRCTESDMLNGTKVHYSRVLSFYGKKLHGFMLSQNAHHDLSILSPVYDLITNISTAENALHTYITESTVNVWRIEDLFKNMTDTANTEITRNYITEAKAYMSYLNAMVIDAKDSIDNITKDGSNVVDIYDKMVASLVSASGAPQTKFLGVSSSGLGSTGEGEQKTYYDNVKQEQVTKFNPKLNRVDAVMARILGIQDDMIKYEWKPLYQIDPKEQAEINKLKVDSLLALQDNGVIEAYHVVENVIEEDILKNLDNEWVEKLKAIVDRANSENVDE